MSLARKTMIGAVLYLLFLALFYVLLPNFIHRQKFDQAFASWRNDPTPQNEEFLRVERT